MPSETLVFVIAFLGVYFIAKVYRDKIGKSRNVSRNAFPGHWQRILHLHIPITRRLPPELRRRLRMHIVTFLTEKTFVGQEGFEVTEDVKLIIAAQACLLQLGRDGPLYPRLDVIHVFEGAFTGHQIVDENIRSDIEHGHVVGLTWLSGPMALAWDHAKHGAIDPVDGHNVVFHEFAHQLDMESKFIDGTPIMDDAESYAIWCEVMERELKKLETFVALSSDRGEDPSKTSLINPYGVNGPEEFFAVVTETFFENPGQLKLAHPNLYDQFQKYYRLDPVEWYD